jgi:hypothetical protein
MVRTALYHRTSRSKAALILAVVLAAASATGCSVKAAVPTPGNEGMDASGLESSVTTAEIPYETCGKPHKIGSSVYMTVTRKGIDQGDNLVRFDLDSGASTVLAEAEGQINWLTANDKWLVWSEDQFLYAMPTSGGKQTTVADSGFQYSPDIYDDMLAWLEHGSDNLQKVLVHDLSTGETKQIATAPKDEGYLAFPVWDRGRLAWTGMTEEAGRYHVYDSETGEKEDYTLDDTEFRYPNYPEISGNRIYSINHDRLQEQHWDVHRLGYYSVQTKSFVPVAEEGFVASAWRASPDVLAVVNSGGELLMQRTDSEPGSYSWHRPLQNTVRYVEVSPDNTFIAVDDHQEGEKTTLYFITAVK